MDVLCWPCNVETACTQIWVADHFPFLKTQHVSRQAVVHMLAQVMDVARKLMILQLKRPQGKHLFFVSSRNLATCELFIAARTSSRRASSCAFSSACQCSDI